METTIAQVIVTCRQPLFRQALITILRKQWPEWHVQDSESPGEVADHLGTNIGSSLLILELDLSSSHDLHRLAQLHARYPDLTLMVLGDATPLDVIWQCITMGARAYVDKSATARQFVQAIQTILANGVFIPANQGGRQVQNSPTADLAHSWTADPDEVAQAAFTSRQHEVFMLLAEGCSTKSIARRLGLSVGTVKVHLAGIYRLLGAHSRIEALAKARKFGSHAIFPLEQPRPEPALRSCFELN